MADEKQPVPEPASPAERAPAAAKPEAVAKPRSGIFTLLLIISFIFIVMAIYLVGWELRNFYGATFGVLSPIKANAVVYPPESFTPPSE